MLHGGQTKCTMLKQRAVEGPCGVSVLVMVRCYDPCEAQVVFQLLHNSRTAEISIAPDDEASLPEPIHAKLLWVISKQYTFAIITVTAL